MTRKSVISPKNWNIKNTTLYTEGLKRGSKRNNLKIIKNPFYLGFPTGIYLFKINNTNRKTSCEICPKLTRKPLNQMCETEFLQMCSFSIILTSIYCLNLSFPLLFYVIPTAISKFPFWFSVSQPWFPAFPDSRIPCISFLFLAFSPLFSAFPSFCSPVLHLGFYR